MSRRHLVGAAVTTCLALVMTACTTTLQGKPVSVLDDPFHVAGMAATDGPSGLRADAQAPTRPVERTDGGKIDSLAGGAISDIEQYWNDAYGHSFDGAFSPVEALISWDANGFDGGFCGEDTYGLINAAYCSEDKTIGWDRGELLPSLKKAYGEMGVTLVLAHEYGHAIQREAGLVKKDTPPLVTEQQADCFAGTYMRWVAEGKSPRFTLSTGDGLNKVLAAVLSFRDPMFAEGDAEVGADEHGSAFERLSAFQFGFTEGPSACAAIDLREINQRRGDLPTLLPEDQTGELPVTEQSVRSIAEAMGVLFTPPRPPQLIFDASKAASCPNARPSSPASYCPATNTIVVDLPGLQAMSVQTDRADSGGLINGDNTAYSVLVSRYMQAVEAGRAGVALDNGKAALRTACLTGVATVKMSKQITTPDGNTIALTAGDVDEAVSGILTNGLVASDVNGKSVPSGFSRIDAFRVGVVGDQDRCFNRFR